MTYVSIGMRRASTYALTIIAASGQLGEGTRENTVARNSLEREGT